MTAYNKTQRPQSRIYFVSQIILYTRILMNVHGLIFTQIIHFFHSVFTWHTNEHLWFTCTLGVCGLRPGCWVTVRWGNERESDWRTVAIEVQGEFPLRTHNSWLFLMSRKFINQKKKHWCRNECILTMGAEVWAGPAAVDKAPWHLVRQRRVALLTRRFLGVQGHFGTFNHNVVGLKPLPPGAKEQSSLRTCR